MIDPLYREVRGDVRRRFQGLGALSAWKKPPFWYGRTRRLRKEYRRILFGRAFPQLLAQWVATPPDHRQLIRGLTRG
jgi:hypothetical protein